ncbi:MAG: succinylglutamate desuccinylase/aspartoacylase family protein [Hyphomicrobiales bacterium]
MTTIPTIRVRVPTCDATRHLGTLAIGDWSTECVVGAGGLVEASLKREGDQRTPIGVFPLRYGLFDPRAFPDFPRGLKFPFIPATEAMIWEEVGKDYNRLVLAQGDERPDERLMRRREEPLFEIIVPFGFNDAVPRLDHGSALFIHAARADRRGTAGCVALPREEMLAFIRRLEPGMVIDIGYEPDETAFPRGEQAAMESVRFAGLEPGPKLIVLGAVHGNETCGPQAILRAIADCRAGRLDIRRGHVTFVPVVNHKAYLQGTREGDRNLNRDLREYILPQCHEDRVANLLCPLLREHDVLLDIHSFRSQGEAFVFAGPLDNAADAEPFHKAQAEGEFAMRLGPSLLMHGWLAAHGRAHAERVRRGDPGAIASKGVGTTEYMRHCGGYGVTLECGQHRDQRAAETAYAAILNALAQLRLIDAPQPKRSVERAIELVNAVLCLAEGDRLARPWATGDAVAAGEVIARRADGEALNAPSAGFVVFPNAEPKPLGELYYFGVASGR